MSVHKPGSLQQSVALKLEENTRAILIGISILVIFLVCFYAYEAFSMKREEDVRIQKYELTQKLEKLTPEDRMDPTSAGFKEIVQNYREILQKDGNSETGNFMRLELGLLLAQAGDCTAAEPLFEKFYAAFSANSPYRALGLNNLGQCLIALKDDAKARDVFLQATAVKGNPFQDFSLFGLARAEERLGHPDKAIESYEQISTQFKTSPLLARSQERKSMIHSNTVPPAK